MEPSDAVRQFTDVAMKLCEDVRREAKKQQANTKPSAQLSIVQLLKICEQILAIRSSGEYNMFDILPV